MTQLSDEAFHALYTLLAHLGLPRPDLNYTTTVKGEKATCALAWPALETGLCLTHDQAAPLARAGWNIHRLETAQLNAVAPLMSALDALSFHYKLVKSAGGAKRTISTDEQRLLSALMRAGAPLPDRNHTVVHDDIMVTPDFAWESFEGRPVKVALELDGWFHHGGRDLDAEIKAAAATDPAKKRALLGARKEQASKDAIKGRVLTLLGWTVVRVTDTELAGEGAHERVAAQTLSVLRNAAAQSADPADGDPGTPTA